MPIYGPYFPGTVSEENIGAQTWSNRDNAKLDDDVYTTAPIVIPNFTNHLYCTNFGVGPIGAGEIVTGVLFSVGRKASHDAKVVDSGVYVIEGGTRQGTNRADAGFWGTVEEVFSYGGENDTFGISLTSTQVQNSNFGFSIQAKKIDDAPLTPRTAYIDYVNLYVYTSASGANPSISGDLDLFIQGYLPSNNNATLFIEGQTTANNQQLYIKGTPSGITELFNYTDLFIEGGNPTNSGLDLTITGSDMSNIVNTLFTQGIGYTTNNITLFVQNIPQEGGTAGMILFSKGKGLDGLTGEEPDDGLPSGVSAFNNNVKLFLNAANSFLVPDGGSSMNMVLAGALTDDHTSNMNMFIGGQWYNSLNNLPLFLYNNIEPSNNNVKLYIKGLGGVDSEGYFPGDSYMNLFIARNTAERINLFMIGPQFNVNNGFNLYINSNPTINSNITLALPYSWDNLINGVSLYSNGY